MPLNPQEIASYIDELLYKVKEAASSVSALAQRNIRWQKKVQSTVECVEWTVWRVGGGECIVCCVWNIVCYVLCIICSIYSTCSVVVL